MSSDQEGWVDGLVEEVVLVRVEKKSLGSVEGLEDEELLDEREAERWAVLSLWEGVLLAVPRGGPPGEPWL